LPPTDADRTIETSVVGWRCAGCGTELDIATPLPWRCPNATRSDRRHVLQIVRRPGPLRVEVDPDPLVAYGSELAWQAFALARGITTDACAALVRQLDDRVAAVTGGVRFRRTPFHHADALSAALDFAPRGGVWVKDETGSVAGSHKARHLVSILLHLKAAELLGVGPRDDRLAIASCGNAALAAAVLAAADHRELEVFVPPTADPSIVADLVRLRAIVTECPRGPSEAPGDPCVHRFRDAVEAGAVPFSVQGPENALSLDAGRTLGWEMAEVLGTGLDRLFVQVGGGALAACVGRAVLEAGSRPRLCAVQTEGCAPLGRAWERAVEVGVPVSGEDWGTYMWPWESAPRSVAEGILDDECYDWLGVVEVMEATGGGAVVVPESSIVRAYELGVGATGIPASPTGTAGLAGLVERRPDVRAQERVAVVFSGVAR
jgi:threonine dehydratase